ncbi:MAG: pyridoxal-phosphate dependent enzyme [Bacteroidetes bacterium]|nr:pyridoxal-phosphate dependent enzyme [Bacteroidota bacterium]
MTDQVFSRIVKNVHPSVQKRTARRCRDRKITIPTLHQMAHPADIPKSVLATLPGVGLWDVNPVNLYRISWKNNVSSGLFGDVNHLEIPSALSGVQARIIGLTGKFFPTGAHKVGAAFGCLVPRLVSGEFDPDRHKAVWPSTGNYCRGGAFDCALLGCTAVAILPEEMSRERFDWLREIGAEVIATPGCESNVKEIYDKCWELRKDPRNVIFNQFDEFGNPLFHYAVTGPALQEVFECSGPGGRVAAYVSATGSAGTIAAGDYLKRLHPGMQIVATEALQCPTLLMNGFGGHRIEGIGDKHVPWVHNVRNTDAIAAIDDEDCMRVLRLLNEEEGKGLLADAGVPADTVDLLPLLGISSICNLLSAIKTARYFELSKKDIILTVFTDSADMYRSRLTELAAARGAYNIRQAVMDLEGPLHHQRPEFFKDLGYHDRKAIHNLKYYTWVEQQGKTTEELNAQWDPEYWKELFEEEPARIDSLIEEFNREIGLS